MEQGEPLELAYQSRIMSGTVKLTWSRAKTFTFYSQGQFT